MAYSIVFKFPDTTTFDASTILTNNIEISESICNNKFESSKNTATFETVFDSTLLSKIESASGFISVEVKDGASWLFNGVLQPVSDLSITNQRDTLTFELFDKGALLEYNLSSPKFYNGQTVQAIVNDILTGSGVSVSSWPTRAGSSTVVRGVFNTELQVWNLIDNLFKEFGFCFYFLPDGTMSVTDLMLSVSSTVTIDDNSNKDTLNGTVKFKKASEKGRGEKISVQADYYDAYKISGHLVFSSIMASDTESIASKSISSMNNEYFATCAKMISGAYTEMVFLDNQVFNVSSPKTSARFLGAENFSGVIYFRSAYDAFITTGTWSKYWSRAFKVTITNGSLTSVQSILYDGNGGGWTTVSSAHYVFSMTGYSDKFVISFKITNSSYFTAGGSTSRFNRLLTHTVKITGDVWLGTHVEPAKITNAKSKVENYSLNYAQTAAQVTDFLNLKSDIANNRTWNTSWESYTDRALGIGATVSMTRAGVSTSGVIIEKKTGITPGVKKFTYKLVAFSTISITTPSTATENAAQPAPPPGTDSAGNLIAPIVSTAIPPIDTASLADSGVILSSDAFGFFDKAVSDFRAKIGSDGSFRLGLTSGKNIQYDPATGNLTMTGDVVAAGGTIAGWQIMSDLLRSAGSGARIELNKTKSRISIFDSSGFEVVAMGYIDGLTDPVSGSPIAAGQYGFWSKNGNTINFKSNIIYEATQQVKNSTFQLLDGSNNVKVTVGVGPGMFSGALGLYLGDYAAPTGWFTEGEFGVTASNGQVAVSQDNTNGLSQVISTQKTLNLHNQGNAGGGSHLSKVDISVANSSGVKQSLITAQNTVAGGNLIQLGAQVNALSSASTITAATGLTVTSGGATITAGGLTVNGGNVVLASGVDEYTTAFTDYSSTSTIVGWSSFTTKKIFYKKIGRLVYVWFQLVGTSNSNTVTFTLPFNAQDVLIGTVGICQDAGAYQGSSAIVTAAGSATLTVYRAGTVNGFTTTGTKQASGSFVYEAQS